GRSVSVRHTFVTLGELDLACLVSIQNLFTRPSGLLFVIPHPPQIRAAPVLNRRSCRFNYGLTTNYGSSTSLTDKSKSTPQLTNLPRCSQSRMLLGVASRSCS